MLNSHQIRVFFLGVVYFILLTAVFLPHHHHEENACYATTHCDEDVSRHDKNNDEPDDHHHDHNTPDEPQHCITTEFYVFTDAGKNSPRIHELKLFVPGHHHFLASCLLCALEEHEATPLFKSFRESVNQNKFTDFVSHQLPSRAPPVFIA